MESTGKKELRRCSMVTHRPVEILGSLVTLWKMAQEHVKTTE